MTEQDKKLVLERYARRRETSLIEAYIKDGPTKIKEDLGLSSEEWGIIFDYLVFEYNLLYKCVLQNTEFFLDKYVKHGMAHVREIFEVNSVKYDAIWVNIFDFLAISCEGLIYHVMEHREKYLLALKARGADFIRKVLGIWNKKYNEHFEKVLDFLLHAVCDGLFSDQTLDRGLRTFSMIMNDSRDFRAINKYGILI